jgi:phage-related protein
MQKIRQVILYKHYFREFFDAQRPKIQDKIMWTLKLKEEYHQVPSDYLKYMVGTIGLYEIRIHFGSDIFRIFCFFDRGNLIVLMNGFQKKTQKTPQKEIEKAIKIKQAYENES